MKHRLHKFGQRNFAAILLQLNKFLKDKIGTGVLVLGFQGGHTGADVSFECER